MKEYRTTPIAIIGQGLAIFGYVSCTLQWLWAGVIGLPPLLESGSLDAFTKPVYSDSPIFISSSFGTSPLMVAIIGFITICMLALTIYILVHLPKAVAKAGETIIQTAAENVLPVVTHHHKLPAKKKRMLTKRLVFYLQLTAVILPLAITLLLPSIASLPHDIVAFIAGWLAMFSIVFFSSSYLFSSHKKTTVRRKA